MSGKIKLVFETKIVAMIIFDMRKMGGSYRREGPTKFESHVNLKNQKSKNEKSKEIWISEVSLQGAPPSPKRGGVL